MPSLSREEHFRRKRETAIDCTVRKDANGNILNPENVSKTSQSFKDECDINKVIKRGIKNGFLVDPLKVRQGTYGDFTSVPDYQTCLNKVIAMREEFASLPAEVRAKFDNDPAKLLAFIQDSRNEQEAIDLGILPKPRFEVKKVETPEGNFWVRYKNDVEIERVKIPDPAPAPGA